MAEIRTERKKSVHAWVWILLAVVVVVAAVVLLAQAGYIDLPVGNGTVSDSRAVEEVLADAHSPVLQEA